MGQSCCKNEVGPAKQGHKQLSQFILCRCIGRGGFGRVWKIVHKKSKEVFALKVMKKLTIMNKNGHKSVVNERAILTEMDHP